MRADCRGRSQSARELGPGKFDAELFLDGTTLTQSKSRTVATGGTRPGHLNAKRPRSRWTHSTLCCIGIKSRSRTAVAPKVNHWSVCRIQRTRRETARCNSGQRELLWAEPGWNQRKADVMKIESFAADRVPGSCVWELRMLMRTFVAQYSFRCPFCWFLDTGAMKVAGKTQGDAQQRFSKTALLCVACERSICQPPSRFVHCTEEQDTL